MVNRTQCPAPEWRLTRQGPKHLKPPRSTSAMTGLVRKRDPTHAMSCLFKWTKNGSFNHATEKCKSGFLFKIGRVFDSNKCWFGQRVNGLRRTKPISDYLTGIAKNEEPKFCRGYGQKQPASRLVQVGSEATTGSVCSHADPARPNSHSFGSKHPNPAETQHATKL